MKRLCRCVAVAVMALILVGLPGKTYANGTETLGPVSGITVASGSGIVAAGTGLALVQPGVIKFTVPAGATVK